MNTIMVAVLLVAFVATVVVAQTPLQVEIAEVTKNCAIAHKIAPEQLGVLRQTADKSTIDASENLKCFAKCAVEASDFIKDGKLNVERVVDVAVAHGRAETTVRENAANCLDKVTAANSCSDAWALYVCFNKQ